MPAGHQLSKLLDSGQQRWRTMLLRPHAILLLFLLLLLLVLLLLSRRGQQLLHEVTALRQQPARRLHSRRRLCVPLLLLLCPSLLPGPSLVTLQPQPRSLLQLLLAAGWAAQAAACRLQLLHHLLLHIWRQLSKHSRVDLRQRQPLRLQLLMLSRNSPPASSDAEWRRVG